MFLFYINNKKIFRDKMSCLELTLKYFTHIHPCINEANRTELDITNIHQYLVPSTFWCLKNDTPPFLEVSAVVARLLELAHRIWVEVRRYFRGKISSPVLTLRTAPSLDTHAIADPATYYVVGIVILWSLCWQGPQVIPKWSTTPDLLPTCFEHRAVYCADLKTTL